MANTPFLDLVKPAGTDRALVSVINSNSDKIDGGVSTLSEQIARKTIQPNGDFNNYSGLGVTNDGHYVGTNIGSMANRPSDIESTYAYAFTFDVKVLNGWAAHTLTVYGSNNRTYVRQEYYQSGRKWTDWQQLATKNEITSFSAIGASSGSSGNVEIQLPSNAMFSSSHPLFMITSFRGSTSNVNEGFAVIKIDNGVLYVTNKTGIQTLSNLAYNSSTKKLTFTTGTYIACLVFGFVLT